VTINLYQVGTAADGSQSLTLVDTTKTSSFDDWAQGSTPAQQALYELPGPACATHDRSRRRPVLLHAVQPADVLDLYNNGGTPAHTVRQLAVQCYDGMHNWNQVQPAPYDGLYTFPSIVSRNPTTGAAGAGSTNGTAGSMVGTNCTSAPPIDRWHTDAAARPVRGGNDRTAGL